MEGRCFTGSSDNGIWIPYSAQALRIFAEELILRNELPESPLHTTVSVQPPGDVAGDQEADNRLAGAYRSP